MKQFFLTMVFGALFTMMAEAEIIRFTQQGKAARTLQNDGLSIGHPSLPINSRVMVTNTVTGKGIKVTVTRRVTASQARIADLSIRAWQELGLSEDSEILITTIPVVRSRPVSLLAGSEPVFETCHAGIDS